MTGPRTPRIETRYFLGLWATLLVAFVILGFYGLQQPWLQALRWLRMPGDSLFLIGVGAFGWFMAGLWRGWSFEPTAERAPARAPFPAGVGITLLLAVGLLLAPSPARAHCDTLDGPVVKDARAALEARDVTVVLKWVTEAKEPEVREAFRNALAVRGLGPEARALADRFFFETLVRVHREGEGAPYTGLKPEGTAISPAVIGVDAALDGGNVDAVARTIAAAADQGLRDRFARAAEARRHASESVAKGRAYVASYVELAHFAERLLESATTPAAHAGASGHGPAAGHGH